MKRSRLQPVKTSGLSRIEPGAVRGAMTTAGAAVWMALLSGSQSPATAETRQATPHIFDDGSGNASVGTPLLPGLLAGYAARPAWMVAGVDYAVGVPTSTALMNPATIAASRFRAFSCSSQRRA